MTSRAFIMAITAAAAIMAGGPAGADSIPGAGGGAGDVAITNGGAATAFTLACGNGLTVDYGTLASNESRHVTSGALANCNGQPIWVTAGGQTLCKWLTDYKTFYAPINFVVNPGTGACQMGGLPASGGSAGGGGGSASGGSVVPGPGSGGKYVIGGWVGDASWDTPLPSYMGPLDVLDFGYITCTNTLRNGTCAGPGMRNANDGPPAALRGAAKSVSYVLGGEGCDPSGWSDANILKAAQAGWSGVDFDNECSMANASISSASAALQGAGKTTLLTFMSDTPKDWLAQIQPPPQYYAIMAFWGAEFCSATTPEPGCANGPNGGYENFLPGMIKDTVNVVGSANSRKVILGIHPTGSNAATVDYWCNQVKANNLGGIFITFIHQMPQDLYGRLAACLAN